MAGPAWAVVTIYAFHIAGMTSVHHHAHSLVEMESY
jgi:hypothetical protein